MRVIDRLHVFLKLRSIAPYSFERTCGIANGYLKKQLRGKGSIGSEILEKIIEKYPEINLDWLVTGSGSMLQPKTSQKVADPLDPKTWQEDELTWLSGAPIVPLLKEKILILEKAILDKERIIQLLEEQIRTLKNQLPND